MDNKIFSSLDSDHAISERAKLIDGSLDMLTSALVGRLIAERLINYAGQPGQTIEYLSACIADALVDSLAKVDTVEMERFWRDK